MAEVRDDAGETAPAVVGGGAAVADQYGHAGTFARRHGLSRSALQYWIRQTGVVGVAETSDFAPVHVTGPSVVEAQADEIVLVSGERVVVPPGASSDQVRVVLTALRPSC